jgi:hypothetical protein
VKSGVFIVEFPDLVVQELLKRFIFCFKDNYLKFHVAFPTLKVLLPNYDSAATSATSHKYPDALPLRRFVH